MKLSKKTRYAIMALSVLAEKYGHGVLSIGEIANGEMIPRRFLEGIFLKLKNKGILDSERGKTGGYFLVKRPEDVTLLDIVTIFEESITYLDCLCDNKSGVCEFCKDVKTCTIRLPFNDIFNYANYVLQKTTLKDLAQNNPRK